MAKQKITSGDVALIAEVAKCSKKAVKLVISGDRAKRNTELQQLIRDTTAFRIKQNRELKQFCKSRRLDIVSPR